MRIISFLLGKRNCQEPHIELATNDVSAIPETENQNQSSLPTENILHLSYPFYLLGRAPR